MFLPSSLVSNWERTRWGKHIIDSKIFLANKSIWIDSGTKPRFNIKTEISFIGFVWLTIQKNGIVSVFEYGK